MRRRPSARTVLAVASLGAAVAFVDVTIVNIAFPDIEGSFRGVPISTLSWVLNAYNIVFAAFLVAAGRIGDLLGRRRLFIVGLELFTAASLLCALAPSVGLLIAFRVVQALGAACLVPGSLALVLNAFPPERRAHGVALLSAVGAAAAGLGPSLGGLLVTIASWRLVFLVNVPIGIVAVALARRRLVESRAPGRRRLPDVLGAVLFGLAIASLVLGVVKGQTWGWGSPRIVAAFAATLVLGALLTWRCTWHRSPIIDLSLLRNRTFATANAMTVVGAAGFYGYTLTNVLFLTGVWRYSVLQAGLSLTPGPLIAFLAAGVSSDLAQRRGHRPVLVFGCLIWGGAVMWFVERVGTTPAFLSEWLPGMVLLGIGAGMAFPNLSGAAVASAPGESFATATGLNSVSRQVGAALGVALVVAILGSPTPGQAAAAFDHAWSFGAGCLFLAGLGCLLIGRVAPERAPGLAAATAAVLGRDAAPASAPTPSPRARRAITLTGPAAAPARTESIADFMGRVPLFAGLPHGLREALAQRTAVRRLASDEWLFREGDVGDAVYVVRAGRLEVVDEATGSVLRELGRGDALGELALLTGATRTASVRARRSSDLIAVSRPDFEALLNESPALPLALSRTLAAQLRDARAPAPTARPRPATVALIGLDPAVPLGELADELVESLRSYLTATKLDGSEAEAPVPGSDPAGTYGPLLDRAEADNGIVVLLAGELPQARIATGGAPDGTGIWAEFALQQADRVVAISSGRPVQVQAADGPLPGPLAALRGCDLVGYAVSAGSGALAGWAQLLEPIESHVVDPASRREDVARMARRLSGRSLGIVLSGGGARAFSHIGVLDELQRAGLTIDRVAGVSMGAFIGAMFAMGRDPDEIDACCFDEWIQRRPLSDFTVPRHSLIRGERFRAMLQRTFGSLAIEELPRSFISGATDLRSGRLVLSRQGPLWEAVGFSICLPVIAPPQVRGRRLLIDGSLVDNLPVEAMADMREGPIIAVDVKATFEPPDAQPPSRDPRPPSIGETLARVLLLGSANTSEAARRHADLVIRPRAAGVGLLEFHQLDAARAAGATAAREALERAPDGLLG